VAGDTNNATDIFVHDTQTGATTQVSVASDGSEGNGDSYFPAISADGRYVAFQSIASNLVAGDSNGTHDVFVHDTQTGATTRVSVASDGSEGNAFSNHPSISADGRYVTFSSGASNLVAGGTNGQVDIYVHDTQLHTTTRVSVNGLGEAANGVNGQNDPAPISADGRYVVYPTNATNLVGNDTNGVTDIYRVLNATP
jgi:Tol biopolymer transport system component